ncbi:MAG: hypothetical protein HY326_13170 [Chloroflexi bacterium]|nr:hypothetical protein [Chloroflexota bacterium]
MDAPEPKNPAETLDLQRKISATMARERPVDESSYPYFPPDYRIPFLHIGTDKQLFLDNFILDHLEDIVRVFPTPERPTDTILKVAEFPWEQFQRPLAQTALQDPDDGKFKLWYVESLVNDIYGDRGQILCYAESTDGLHWEKPLSETCIPYQNHRATNIVLQDTGHHIALVLNQDQSDPSRKYLLLYNPSDKARAQGKRVMSSVAASADGLHWATISEDTPYRHHHLSRAIWDEAIQKWVAYSQYSHHWNFLHRIRQIGRQESADFIYWSPKEVVLSSDWDPNLLPNSEFHDMSVRKVGGQYIGIATEFIADPLWCVRNHTNWRDHGRCSLALYGSRDGKRWQRVGGPGPWVDHGGPGSVDYGKINHPVAGQIVHSGKCYILHSTQPEKQHWFGRQLPGPLVPEAAYTAGLQAWQNLPHRLESPVRRIGALVLREDGWAELKPVYEHGKVYTKQFVFEGSSLAVNADAYGGYFQIEVLDPYFKPYEGFAVQDCLPVYSDNPDQIWHTVRWQNGADVRALWNKPVRLCFHLHQASLYAFQFGQMAAA